MASSFGTFAFSPPASSSSIFQPQDDLPRRNLTPTAAHPEYSQQGDYSQSYPPYSLSPHDVHQSSGAHPPSTAVELNESSFHPSPSLPFDDYNTNSPNLNGFSKPASHPTYPYQSGSPHEGGGGSDPMDGFGPLVEAPFLGAGHLNELSEEGNSMTAFGSLPTFDQNSILAHRSSFDPPSSASSFASSNRPTTAGGASTLLQMSRGGALYGSPAFFPDKAAALGAYQSQGGGQYASGSFSGAGSGETYAGDGETSRTSTYDPSLIGSTSQYPPQHLFQLSQYQQNTLPYQQPPAAGSNGSQTQPSFSDLDPSPSTTDALPLYLNSQPYPHTTTPSYRRASESHLLHQDPTSSFYSPQNSAAFPSPSNASPLATTHQYSSPSTTATVNPNLRVGVPVRRPSSSSVARRPSTSSHAFSYDVSQQQFSGRPQPSSGTQRVQGHHPYAQGRRRESVGIASSSTQAFWDQAVEGALSIGEQAFSPMVGGPAMRPQTSDGIPGSALHNYSAVPNFFRPSGPARATTGIPTATTSISPRNLTQPAYAPFGNGISPSGSDFPLQQPIFAPPHPATSRHPSLAIPTSSTSSFPTNPSTEFSSSSAAASHYATSLSRPSTAPSVGMSSAASSSNHVAPPKSPPPPPLPNPEILETLPPGQIRALVRAHKGSNLSPVTGRPKRPRRKHEEVERLYDCLAEGCGKAYGTLNHLNQHITMQGHGVKRQPAEFRELRREWRMARKAASKAAAAKEKAKTAKKAAKANPDAQADAPSTGGQERRRSSGTSGATGEDDSGSEDDYSDQEEAEPVDAPGVAPSVLPHPLLSGVSSIHATSNSSPSTSSFPTDSPQFSPAPNANSFHYHHRLLSSNGSSDSPSPLEPHLAAFPGSLPYSSSYSPIQPYSPHVNTTPDFNHWAFSLNADGLSPSTPNSAVRGAPSGLVQSSGPGFSPLATSSMAPLSSAAAANGSATTTVPPPEDATTRGGRPRRLGAGTRKSGGSSYTIHE